MSRLTNEELCQQFRELMTMGFYVPDSSSTVTALEITKPWRGDLWKAFREIEARLCPSRNGSPR